MNTEFKRFSHKIVLEAYLKHFILSLSLALLAVGIPLLILKLLSIEIAFWIYIIIGVGVFCLCFGLSFLIKPNKLKIARRIDSELGLKENVQTMVEYEQEEGFMLDIQRDDTTSKLESLPTKKLRLRINFVYFIALAISASVFVTSFAIPVVAKTDDSNKEEDKEYEDDDYTIQRLHELIEYVEESNCNTEYKIRTVNNLTDLIEKIKVAKLESEMKTAVNFSIDKLHEDLKPSNSHKEIYKGVLNKDLTPNGIYFGKLIDELEPNKLDTLVANMTNQLVANKKEGIDVLTEARYSFKDKLESSVLKDSYGKDELFIAIIEFGKTCGLQAQELDAGRISIEDANKNISTASELVKSAMDMQITNTKTCSYVELELKVLFNMLDENENEPSTEPSNPNDDETDEETFTESGDHDGGFGDGDILYGSDDEIYDPVLDRYVKYGDVLEAYRAEIEKDVLEGVLTPEMIEFYREYYKRLTEVEENRN